MCVYIPSDVVEYHIIPHWAALKIQRWWRIRTLRRTLRLRWMARAMQRGPSIRWETDVKMITIIALIACVAFPLDALKLALRVVVLPTIFFFACTVGLHTAFYYLFEMPMFEPIDVE